MPRGVRKFRIKDVAQQGVKVETVLRNCNGWTEDDFLMLAVECLDQGGLSKDAQLQIWKLILALCLEGVK